MTAITDYITHGWQLCAIPPGEKGPVGVGWNMAGVKPEDGQNVGLLHALSGTAALDVDSLPEATAWLAERGVNLQALLDADNSVQIVSGREGRAKLLYRMPLGMPLPTKKVTVDGKTVFELRCASADGKSMQDVIPPSRHPSGTTYQWGGKGNWKQLPEVPPELMAVWLQMLAKDSERNIPMGSGQTPASMSEIRSAVMAINPDCSRQTWIEVGMGLEVLGEQSGDPAACFELFDSWSAGSEQGKYSAKVTAQQWRSFKPRPNGIGVGTLFHHAKLAGWKRPVPDVQGGFQPIPAVPASREEQRRENIKIGEGDTFDPAPEVLSTQEMIDRFIFLADGSRVFDRKFPAHVLGFPDFKNLTARNVEQVPTGEFYRGGAPKTKTVTRAELWVKSDHRMSAISTTFKPGAGLFVVDPNGRHCANLWNGYPQGPLAPQWAVEVLFVEHVKWLFGDRADDFLDWLAHIQQRPGELPHTAWLHISSHTGTGRNWLSGVLARVFAGHVAASLDLVAMLENGFNERLSRKVLAVVDEIRQGGSGSQWNQAEAMKQMITAEVRNINTKYGRQSMEFNSCRFLMFSNHRSAIPIDNEDRRFEVVISDDSPKGEAYYATLYAALADPAFIAGVAWYLSQRDLSKFNPGRHAAMSAAKQQVIQMSTPESVVSMREFSAAYPCELVTANTLERVAGVSAVGGNSAFFTRSAEECGWISIKRKVLANGQRKVVYARREVAMKWVGIPRGFEKQLPVYDGGEVVTDVGWLQQ